MAPKKVKNDMNKIEEQLKILRKISQHSETPEQAKRRFDDFIKETAIDKQKKNKQNKK